MGFEEAVGIYVVAVLFSAVALWLAPPDGVPSFIWVFFLLVFEVAGWLGLAALGQQENCEPDCTSDAWGIPVWLCVLLVVPIAFGAGLRRRSAARERSG